MSWHQGQALLRCDQHWSTGKGHHNCSAAINADTNGAALRLAAERGWGRGNRGGLRVDLCPAHKSKGDTARLTAGLT